VPILPVSDPDDPRIHDYRNIPDPELVARGGIFIAEGRLVVQRLIEASRFRARSAMVTEAAFVQMRDLFARSPALPVYIVSQSVMNGITGFNMHRGCLAIGERVTMPDVAAIARGARRIVVMERVANSDNIGGVFRNAAAFGVEGVVLDPVSTDPLYRKAIRTSVGATLHVPFARAGSWPEPLATLRAEGLTVVALTPSMDAVPLRDAARELRDARVAIVLGHEGEGLTTETMATCDLRVSIPIAQKIDSLNVATAAGIALYELTSNSPWTS